MNYAGKRVVILSRTQGNDECPDGAIIHEWATLVKPADLSSQPEKWLVHFEESGLEEVRLIYEEGQVPPPFKSVAQIEKLKEDWSRDPEWHIEDTVGFERHREELIEFSKQKKAEWEQKRKEHEKALRSKSCPMSFNVWVDYGSDDRGHAWLNCMTDGCAWWDAQEEKCGMMLRHKVLPIDLMSA